MNMKFQVHDRVKIRLKNNIKREMNLTFEFSYLLHMDAIVEALHIIRFKESPSNNRW